MKNRYFNSKIPCCVVSPTTHATGLGAIRSLRHENIPVVSFDWKKSSLGRFSTQCHAHLVDLEETEEAIVESLIQLGQKFIVKPVLIMCCDELTMYCNNNRKKLEKFFHFIVSEHHVVENLIRKEKFYGIADQANIPIPKSWYIQELADFERYKQEFVYPCIIKPTTSQPFRSIFRNKAIEVHSAEEFLGVQPKLAKHKIKYMLQEIIPGDQTRLYTFGAYSNANADALAIFTGRKLRQFPPDYGGCRLGEAVYNEQLIELGKKVLKVFHFQGISQIEFKLDDRDGIFKLIEVNVRGWTWDFLATATGSNFYVAAYNDALGQPQPQTVSQSDGFLWHNLIEDLCNCLWLYRKSNFFEQEMSLVAWGQSLLGRKRVEAFFRWYDPIPFFIRSYAYLKQNFFPKKS